MFTCNKSTDSIDRQIQSILELGIQKINLSMVGGCADCTETPEDFQYWKEALNRLVSLSLMNWLDDRASIYPIGFIFESILFRRISVGFCSASRESFNIHCYGQGTPCYKYYNYSIYSVENPEITDSQALESFNTDKKTARDAICKDCWAYRFCQGFCLHDFNTMINIFKTRCNLIQYLIREALYQLTVVWIDSPEKIKCAIKRIQRTERNLKRMSSLDE